MKKLLIALTPGTGLSAWRLGGILNREIKPYEAYAAEQYQVYISTTTYTDDVTIKLPDKLVLVRGPHRYFMFLWPLYHFQLLFSVDLIKTNQGFRSWWYVLSAKLFNIPIVVRNGWVAGRYRERELGKILKVQLYQQLERISFRLANIVCVPTKEDKQWILDRYKLDASRIRILPNYIDCKLFDRRPVPKIPKSVITICRLEKIKNIDLIIDACKAAGVLHLTIVGKGSEIEELKRKARFCDFKVNFLNSLPNENIPALLSEHEIFVLASAVEGYPKALLEAMACGISCIGTNVDGTREVISDRETGLLVELNVNSMQSGIKLLLQDCQLRQQLGLSARKYVMDNCSIEKIFQIEKEIFDSLI